MFIESRLRWLAILLFIFLLSFISCSRMNTAGKEGAVRLSAQDVTNGEPAVRFQAWLFVPRSGWGVTSTDASEDAGRIYMRITVHAFSPKADFESLRRFVERGDAGSLHATFGKTERATVEYPKGGRLRERFAFAVQTLAEGTRRILLFSEGGVDAVNKCWLANVVDLKVNALGEGQGLSYRGRVFFTEEGELDLDRPSQLSPPSRIGDVRLLKEAPPFL